MICATHDLPVVLRVPVVAGGFTHSEFPDQGLSSKCGYLSPLPPANSIVARPRLRMLLRHCVRRAASRALCTAGEISETRTAMIEMTTNNSIRENPAEKERDRTGRLRKWPIFITPSLRTKRPSDAGAAI